MGYSFNNPANKFLSKCKKISQGQKKMKELQNSRKKTEFSTNDPLNLLNAVLRALAKLYKQKFDIFSLKSELKAERVPVNPLKSFLWTRSRQFWKPMEKQSTKFRRKKM